MDSLMEMSYEYLAKNIELFDEKVILLTIAFEDMGFAEVRPEHEHKLFQFADWIDDMYKRLNLKRPNPGKMYRFTYQELLDSGILGNKVNQPGEES